MTHLHCKTENKVQRKAALKGHTADTEKKNLPPLNLVSVPR